MHCNSRQDDLIYDIGAHKGDDAAFYLAKGFRVISVEAHPTHASVIRKRFSSEIEDGRLVLVNKGLHTKAGVVDFYVHQHDVWSSFVRNDQFTSGAYRTIPVEVIRFKDLIDDFGIPYYLKIDIERLDFAVVADLPHLKVFPRYISFEHHNRSQECLDILVETGYDSFKFIEQTGKNLHPLPNPPLEGQYVDCKITNLMTGAFGEETMGGWMSFDTLLEFVEEAEKPGCWYDFHARHRD